MFTIFTGDGVERRQEAAERDDAGKEYRAEAKQEMGRNGGSDVITELPSRDEWPDPGHEEMEASLYSFTDDWRLLRESDLYRFIGTGKPPSTVSPADLLRYRDKSRFMGQVVPPLVPVVWLEEQMDRLHITPAFHTKLADKYGAMAFGAEEFGMWARVVNVYNGFIKTLAEMMWYAPSKKQRTKEVVVVSSDDEE